jgi:hypothetical protein
MTSQVGSRYPSEVWTAVLPEEDEGAPGSPKDDLIGTGWGGSKGPPRPEGPTLDPVSRSYATGLYLTVLALGAIPMLLIVDAWKTRHDGRVRWLQIIVYAAMILGSGLSGYRAIASLISS